ncbi:MAG: hypothetical protein RL557_542 [archaeon]|jgi:uncharacterized membrane protein SpoIIM required for sporulation
MLELLINPAKAEKRPWEMLFIGIFYGALSLLLTHWIFASDPVLSKYRGILVVTFSVMFSLPFMYFAIKNEEEKDLQSDNLLRLLEEHGKALTYFMFLFLGFVIAFSTWYIMFETGSESFTAQIETFCIINRPTNFENCVNEYAEKMFSKTTSFSTARNKIVTIFANNMYVLIFTLIFSLIFGAGAIFILAWNASVISAAIGIFAKSEISKLPLGLARYMIHGIPEILAYFIGALAGGIVSIAIIKHDMKSEKFWIILQDSLNLIILAVIVLFIAALIEVFITPVLF